MTEWPDFEQLSAAFATRGSYDTATFFKGARQSWYGAPHPRPLLFRSLSTRYTPLQFYSADRPSSAVIVPS